MNTHSKKWNITIQHPIDHLGDGQGALDLCYFFALPNTMDNHEIVQVIQSATTLYDLQDLNEEDITEWRKVQKKIAQVRWMKKIRATAGLLRKLKRELRQVHKLSKTGNGFSGIWDIGRKHWVWK